MAHMLPKLPPVPPVAWEISTDLPTSNAFEFAASLAA
jgi:hypothetical protein